MPTFSSDNQPPILALLIEDSEADADLFQEMLCSDNATSIVSEWASTLKSGLKLAEQKRFDVILLDLSLPDSFSLSTLKKTLAAVQDVPIIIMTGLADQELGLLAVKEGAQDYLIKGQVNTDVIHRAIRYAIERKKAELFTKQSAADAVESEARLRLALKSSQLEPWIWQANKSCPDFDNQFATLFGGSAPASYDDFISRVHDSDRLQVQAAIKAARNTTVADLETEFKVVWPDESIHWIRMLGQTTYDDTGKPIKMTGVYKDTTKSKDAQEAARKLALLEQKDEFMALLAHDLRNPIVGTSRILSHILAHVKDLPNNVRDWLSDICLSQQTLLQLINNVMDSYRLETEKQSLYCTETSLRTFIESTVAELKPLAEWNKLSLTFSIADLQNVAADSLAMHRVLSNLVSNALKFTPAGGKIDISAFDQDGFATIQVRDTGAGIEAENVVNIFDRFFQSRGEHRATGSGLGLYLCKKLMESQNGTITCQSVVGKGTVFEIKLPYFRECGDLQWQAILVVSQRQEETEAHLANICFHSGIAFDIVPDAATAVLYAKTGKYKVAFVDVETPGEGSLRVAVAVKDLNLDLPIIGYGDGDKLQLILNSSAFNKVIGPTLEIADIKQGLGIAV